MTPHHSGMLCRLPRSFLVAGSIVCGPRLALRKGWAMRAAASDQPQSLAHAAAQPRKLPRGSSTRHLTFPVTLSQIPLSSIKSSLLRLVPVRTPCDHEVSPLKTSDSPQIGKELWKYRRGYIGNDKDSCLPVCIMFDRSGKYEGLTENEGTKEL